MSFLQEARNGRYRDWPWYLLGVGAIFFGYLLGQAPLIMVVRHLVNKGRITLSQAQDFFETVDLASIGLSSAAGLLLLLCSFLGAMAALFCVVRFLHQRRFFSLIRKSRVQWNKVLLAIGIWFILTALMEVIAWRLAPETYHLAVDWGQWIPLFLVCLLILPIQTSFEEMFVRGYLFQKLGLMTQRPWIAILLTSLFFGAMHLGNPEIREFGLGVMLTYYVSVGAFLAVLTILDDGLEYALGIHAATNMYGAAFVSYKGSALQTATWFKVDAVDAVWMLILFYFSAGIFILLIKWRHGLGNAQRLWMPIVPETSEQSIAQEAPVPSDIELDL